MDLTSTLLCCLSGRDNSSAITLQGPPTGIINEKPSLQPLLTPSTNIETTAENIVTILLQAEKRGATLKAQLNDAVTATGWTEWLAEKVLRKLEEALRAGREKMGPALADAYDTAMEAVKEEFSTLWEYAREHPLEIAVVVVLSLLALGVLVELAPFVVEALGFGELGPVEGSFAAGWQATYGESVPKGSLFSLFQRLGMTWGKKA